MFRVERMAPEDFPFAVQLSNTMNWNMTLEDFELAMSLEPEGCFLLFQDSKRVGITTTVSFGKMGWLGNLIVREEYRRKNTGGLLVNRAVDYLSRKGVGTIGLYAYPHLVAFYEHFGFKLDKDFSVLRGEPVFPSPINALKKIQEEFIPSVIAFDSKCFGANRAKLLESMFFSGKNLCYGLIDNEEVKGFAAAKLYDRMADIGPIVCKENGVDDAKLLLGNLLAKLPGLKVSICVPRNENALLKQLFASGFQEDFIVSRMFLGPKVTAKCIYSPESLERG